MFEKLISDLFDLGADLTMLTQQVNADDLPDLSAGKDMLTPEEREEPLRIYAPREEVPDIKFEHVTDVKVPGVFDVELLRGEFPSPVQTPYEANNTVHLDYYRQRDRGDAAPCVLMVPGWRMDSLAYFDWWCWRYAAWGLNAMMFHIPYHFRRLPEGTWSGQLMLTTDTLWNIAALKQSFADMHLTMNWLLANGAGPVGCYGISYGGFLSGLYACQAHNSDFSIMGMPPIDPLDVIPKTYLGDKLKQLEKQGVRTMLSDPSLPALFDLRTMSLNVPRRKVFINMGLYDRLVPPEHVIQAADNWGGLPWLMKYKAGHINTFGLNFKFDRDHHRFIRKEVLR